MELEPDLNRLSRIATDGDGGTLDCSLVSVAAWFDSNSSLAGCFHRQLRGLRSTPQEVRGAPVDRGFRPAEPSVPQLGVQCAEVWQPRYPGLDQGDLVPEESAEGR